MKKGFNLKSVWITLAGFLALALIIICITLPTKVHAHSVLPINDDPKPIIIANATDMIAYSRAYYTESSFTYNNETKMPHPNDILRITASALVLPSEDSGFISIGNDTNPFCGKIEFNSLADSYLVLDEALFGTVTTGARITFSESDTTIPLSISRRVNNDEPLLAVKVIAAQNPDPSDTSWTAPVADWDVTVDNYVIDNNIKAYNYSGLFGMIDNNCQLDIAFTDNTFLSSAVRSVVSGCQIDGNGESLGTGKGNAGVICGTVGTNVTLTATVSGNNIVTAGQTVTSSSTGGSVGGMLGVLDESSSFTLKLDGTALTQNISTDGGHAGGLVGEMRDGASVTVDYVSTNTSLTIGSTVHTSAAKYVGGIAGWAKNAQLNVSGANDGNTLTVNCIIGHVTDDAFVVEGAGGLYGYYLSENDSADTSIDLTGIITGEGLTVNALTYAGGIIGRLEANNSVLIDGGPTPAVGDGWSSPLKQVSFGKGEFRGGVIASYKNTAAENPLRKTLEIKDAAIYIKSNADAADTNDFKKYGGLIGVIDSDGSETYVHVKDVAVVNKGAKKMGGGVIGTMGSKGSFLDTEGLVSVGGTFIAGLVDDASEGVIRLQGITDIGGYYASSDAHKLTAGNDQQAQLVNKRGSCLVYAKGTGSDYNSGTGKGWTFYRNQSDRDDIGDWGEVLRLDGTTLVEGDIANITSDSPQKPLYFDSTNHTVTVANAVTSMATTLDFVKTALNMQHNSGSNTGALHFNDITNSTIAVLCAKNLSITADISLAGTGIYSLMRDDDDSKYYSATFNGNNKTITLSTGETYGLFRTSTPAAGGEKAGMIYGHVSDGHKHVGLLARTNGATVQNLTVAGNMWVGPNNDEMYIGGVIANAKGGLTLTNITANENQVLKTNTNSTIAIGTVGYFTDNGAANEITVTNCKFNSNISRSGNKTGIYSSLGFGVIADKEFSMTVTGNELGGTYTDTSSFSNTRFGGLICQINANDFTYANNTGTDDRTITIKNLTVKDSFSAVQNISNTTARSTGAGGFLGYNWLNTKVVIGETTGTNGLTIGASTGPTLSATGGNLGGLCYKATGYWQVNHVNVNKANISAAGVPSFGFIINDGTNINNTKRSALYLEVIGDYYNISNTDLTGTFSSAYDELVAYSCFGSDNVTQNGQAVVSYRVKTASDADGVSGTADLKMTGADCSTYQNCITGFEDRTNNSNTRYYYSIDKFRTSQSTDPEKLMIWSLNQYACDNIKKLFTNPFSGALTGEFDMRGYSYYPVNASPSIGNSTFIFYSREIDKGESGTGDSDGSPRSNVKEASQHYLMHGGLLHNSGGVTVTGNVTFKGNVGLRINNGDSAITRTDELGSGFLICGMLGNNDTTTATFKSNPNSSITLDGAWVYNRLDATNGYVTGGVNYAPLLINRIGRNTSFDLQNVKTTDTAFDNDANPSTAAIKRYASIISAGNYAGTSLIGRVGSNDATNINLNFAGIALDARIAADGNAGLNAAYSTTRSVFSRATLLESFEYELGSSSGYYNYYVDDDWDKVNPSDTYPKHNVTYGREISGSHEFVQDPDGVTTPGVNDSNLAAFKANSNQQWYMGEAHTSKGTYTRPDNDPRTGTNAAYDFWAAYRPYVAERNFELSDPNSTTNRKHELSVNVPVFDIIEGCGKYNDPYWIKDAGQIVQIAKLLHGDPISASFKIILPKDLGGNTEGVFDGSNMWHGSDGESDHAVYQFSNSASKFTTSTEDFPSFDVSDVREYLAGAYYLIVSDEIIISDSSFYGLGATEEVLNKETPYAFRGVIVGKRIGTDEGNPIYPTIKMRVAQSFIENANGCVIRNLNFELDYSVSLTQALVGSDSNSRAFKYNGGYVSYGLVINKVMGGDNLIDRVTTSFVNVGNGDGQNSITLSGACAMNIPVGGYVGVVVNGGVRFRNMDELSANDRRGLGNFTLAEVDGGYAGYSDTVFEYLTKGLDSNGDMTENGSVWLYVNPIIGRVLSGYAFTETTSYKYLNDAVSSEALASVSGYTMNNGRKNYSIPDIKWCSKSDLGGITVSAPSLITVTAGTATTHEVYIPDEQAMYLFACIVNSGAGSAAYSSTESTEGNYPDLKEFSANRKYTATRYGRYDSVGVYKTGYEWDKINKNTDYSSIIDLSNMLFMTDAEKASVSDYNGTGESVTNNDNVENNDRYKGSNNVPYIIGHYTNKADDGFYHARSLTHSASAVSSITLEANHTYNLPEGFRGIGTLYYHYETISNITDERILNISLMLKIGDTTYSNPANNADTINAQKTAAYDFNGNGATVNLHMYYYEYNSLGDTARESYTAYKESGFGLFTRLYSVNWVNWDKDTKDNIVQTDQTFDKVVTMGNVTITGEIRYGIRNEQNSGKESKLKWWSNFTSIGTNETVWKDYGLIKTILYKTDDVDTNKGSDAINTIYTLPVGGFIGSAYDRFTLRDITIDNLKIDAAQFAGGILGRARGNWSKSGARKLCIIIGCHTDAVNGVSITSGGAGGGLVGCFWSPYVLLAGAESGAPLTVCINKIEMKSRYPSTDSYSGNYNCVGGLIGHADCGREINTTGYPNLTMVGFKIVGIGSTSYIGKQKPAEGNDTLSSYDANMRFFAGGAVGIISNTRTKAENVTVEGLNITAVNAGGIIGEMYVKQWDKSGQKNEFKNLVANGNGTAAITGKRLAGGVIAHILRGSPSGSSKLGYGDITISGTTVKGYTIETKQSTTTVTNDTTYANPVCAGGLVGAFESTGGDYIFTTKVYDTTVKNCSVITHYEDLANDSRDGTGGLVGAIWRSGTKCALIGSNILIDSVDIQHFNGTTEENRIKSVAYVVGNNYGDTSEESYSMCGFIRLVGVCINNCKDTSGNVKVLNRLVGNGKDKTEAAIAAEGNFGKGKIPSSNTIGADQPGYIILADYNCASATQNPNTGFESLTGYKHASYDRAAASPYVVLNSKTVVGAAGSDKFLTGDGLASSVYGVTEGGVVTVNGIPILGIKDDTTNRYLFAQDAGYIPSDIATHLSTFGAEQGIDMANDFTVLLIEDINRANTTALINDYINAVMNTPGYNFANTNSNSPNYKLFSVQIYKLTWRPSKSSFKVDTTGAALKQEVAAGTDEHAGEASQFYMENTTVDTDNNTASLIDIRFYDPDSTKVAYHLYVPVFVRKLLKFDFQIASANGTNYLSDWYADPANDRFGRIAETNGYTMENLGAPVTMLFEYSYFRSGEEWKRAISNGDSVMRNYTKVLNFSISGANANNLSKQINRQSVLVLVDVSRNGKPYYAYFGEAWSAGKINLASFHEELGTYGVANTSASFQPVNLNELFTVTAELTGEGDFIECEKEEATVTAKVGGVEKYLKFSKGANAYSITNVELTAKADDAGMYVEGLSTDADVIPAVLNGDVKYFRLPTSSESASAQRYSVASERYYISVYSKSEEHKAYLYRASNPTVFNADSADSAYPSRARESDYSNIILGSIFEQTGVSITDTTPREQMTYGSNDTLSLSMSSTVRVYSDMTSGDYNILDFFSGDETKGINIYHSFLVYLTKADENGARKYFDDAAELTVTFTIAGVTYGPYTTTNTSDIQHFLNTGSFAEFRSLKSLNSLLRTGGAAISADITIKYNERDKTDEHDPLAEQFPERTVPSYGVTVSGRSNVGYDKQNTAYSKSTYGEFSDSSHPNSYYRQVSDKTAKLNYRSKTTAEGASLPQYDSQLGLNPIDPNDPASLGKREIMTVGVYNITDILEKAEGYDYVRCELRLKSRNDNYVDTLALKDSTHDVTYLDVYDSTDDKFFVLDGITLGDDAGGHESFRYDSDNNVFIFIIDRHELTGKTDDDEMYQVGIMNIPINFSPITGTEFEALDQVYSNYMVELTVTLVKFSGSTIDPLSVSSATDFIKYTNARIFPEVFG